MIVKVFLFVIGHIVLLPLIHTAFGRNIGVFPLYSPLHVYILYTVYCKHYYDTMLVLFGILSSFTALMPIVFKYLYTHPHTCGTLSFCIQRNTTFNWLYPQSCICVLSFSLVFWECDTNTSVLLNVWFWLIRRCWLIFYRSISDSSSGCKVYIDALV